MQSPSPLVTEAEFPGAGDFTLDGEISRVRVAGDEVLPQRKCERQNGQRESRAQVILIGKERTGRKRIEALLIGQIKHVWERVQHALENGRAIEVRRRVQAAAASCGDKRASGGGAAGREQLYGPAAVGRYGVESGGQQRMIVEDAVAGTNDGLAVACRIPCQTKARREVVKVARDSFDHAEGLFGGRVDCGGRSKERTDFHVVANAVVDGQVTV